MNQQTWSLATESVPAYILAHRASCAWRGSLYRLIRIHASDPGAHAVFYVLDGNRHLGELWIYEAHVDFDPAEGVLAATCQVEVARVRKSLAEIE